MPIAAKLRCRLLNTARIKSLSCHRVPLYFRASVPLSGKHRRIVASVPSVGKHGRIAPLRMTVWRRQLGVVAVKPGCLAKIKLLYCCILRVLHEVSGLPQSTMERLARVEVSSPKEVMRCRKARLSRQDETAILLHIVVY